MRLNVFPGVFSDSLHRRVHFVAFDDAEPDFISNSKVSILPIHVFFLGNQQSTYMQLKTPIIPTDVVNYCGKNALFTDSRQTYTRTVNVNLECSHEVIVP